MVIFMQNNQASIIGSAAPLSLQSDGSEQALAGDGADDSNAAVSTADQETGTLQPNAIYSTSDAGLHAAQASMPGVYLALPLVMLGVVTTGRNVFGRFVHKHLSGASLDYGELANLVDSVSARRCSEWEEFCRRYYGSLPPFMHELEIGAKKTFNLLTPVRRWSFSSREAGDSFLDIERCALARGIMPPVSFAEYYVRVFHSARSCEAAAMEIETLDKEAARCELLSCHDELQRFYRVFLEIYRKSTRRSESTSLTGENCPVATCESDMVEVHKRSHKIADSYVRIIQNVSKARRTTELDRAASIMLSIKASNLILRAMPSDQHRGLIEHAVDDWKLLRREDREAYLSLDAAMGMRSIHELGRDSAPFSVICCFLNTWRLFEQVVASDSRNF